MKQNVLRMPREWLAQLLDRLEPYAAHSPPSTKSPKRESNAKRE